jgi:hypothetical protein
VEGRLSSAARRVAECPTTDRPRKFSLSIGTKSHRLHRPVEARVGRKTSLEEEGIGGGREEVPGWSRERQRRHTMRTPNNSQSIFQNSISRRIILLKLKGMSAPSCDPRKGNVPDWQCSSTH